MFGFGKKEDRMENCCCGGNCTQETMVQAEQTKAAGGIKVLGGGCSKCHELEGNTRAALAELNIREDVELISDFAVIASYGVMTTPALVVDNRVVSYGKVLKTPEIVAVLKKARGVS